MPPSNTLARYRNKHKGKDIYVLGSGATLNFVDAGFFHNKIVIAVNHAAERMGLAKCTEYSHTHYHNDAYAIATSRPHSTVFTCEGDQGYAGKPDSEMLELRNLVTYPHVATRYDFDVERSWPAEGGLLVGSTSVHGAMHLAAYMGAATVMLAGVDCGTLDGHVNQGSYKSGVWVDGYAPEVLARWEAHLRLVKAKLQAVYGCRIYSLNPFVNLNNEGHTWN